MILNFASVVSYFFDSYCVSLHDQCKIILLYYNAAQWRHFTSLDSILSNIFQVIEGTSQPRMTCHLYSRGFIISKLTFSSVNSVSIASILELISYDEYVKYDI